MKRSSSILILSLASILAGGCMTPEQQAAQRAVASYFAGDYGNAAKLLDPIARNTNEDFVLNNVRLGSSALVQYDLPTAEAAFLRAYEVINSLGVNNGGRSIGAVLVDEKIKIWRGEPFERAMANYYLGLVYYMQGDYSNARGAFENALFKLRDYAGDDKSEPKADKYRDVESNFILAQYLLGRSHQRLGREDLARANLKRVSDLRPQLAGLADYDFNLRANVLLVIDFGVGPHKATDLDGALVGFAPKPSEVGPVPLPNVLIDGQYAAPPGSAAPLVDLIALAQDRKWQDLDTVRAVKSVLGTGLLAAGAYELGGRHKSDTQVGLALVAAGLLLKATSQADVRGWEMLPRSTFVVPLTVPSGTHDLTVEFPIAGGMRQTFRGVSVPSDGEATFYFRMLRLGDVQVAWPPPTMRGLPGQPSGPAAAPVAATSRD